MLDYLVERRFFAARKWSNLELRKLGPHFSGDGINVSGWRDSDKEGGHYRGYFPRLSSYITSNYSGDRGLQGGEGELFLDLEAELRPELKQRFDLVFNHTTLEHVFDFRRAFANLCEMAREAVLIVVPWAQVTHPSTSFGDYWRFSPDALAKLFEAEGLYPAYLAGSPMRNTSIYVVGLGVRDQAMWRKKLGEVRTECELGNWIGRPSMAHDVLRRLGWARRFGLVPRNNV